jgi:hypothetical protein
VIDRDRCDRILHAGERAEWHELARCGAHIEVPQCVGVELELRIELEHDVILVELREDCRNLTLAKGVVQCIVDRLWRDPEAGCGVAVDAQCRAWGRGLGVRRDVLQIRQ